MSQCNAIDNIYSLGGVSNTLFTCSCFYHILGLNIRHTTKSHVLYTKTNLRGIIVV